MNSYKQNPVIQAALIVFGTWWLILTIWSLGFDTAYFIENISFIFSGFYYWILGIGAGFSGVALWVYLNKKTVQDDLGATSKNGIISLLGPVPVLADELKRVTSPKDRLQIHSPRVNAWLSNLKEEHPDHYIFFMALWDTYSAHKNVPASHRRGGHAKRMLWHHCIAVVNNGLEMAETFEYQGVFLKKRGKKRALLSPMRDANYVFNKEDPILGIVLLAHDIGKLEVYQVNKDGSVSTKEEGASADDDDNKILHDVIGARVLARMPEYHALPIRDRLLINMVVGHYHHPSSVPVDDNGTTICDRTMSMMELLREADRLTGIEEGRITADSESDITEEQAEHIYQAFVSIITTLGRINGTGNKNLDGETKIGQKHDGLVVIKELELRKLILAKLGISLSSGESKYDVTIHLLQTLLDKGLLYTNHRGIEFDRYLPLWRCIIRSSKTGSCIAEWSHTIIIKPTSAHSELTYLEQLPNTGSKLEIFTPIYTHNNNIRDPERLRSLIIEAFGQEDGAKVTIPSFANPVDVRVDNSDEAVSLAEPKEAKPIGKSEVLPIERAHGADTAKNGHTNSTQIEVASKDHETKSSIAVELHDAEFTSMEIEVSQSPNVTDTHPDLDVDVDVDPMSMSDQADSDPDASDFMPSEFTNDDAETLASTFEGLDGAQDSSAGVSSQTVGSKPDLKAPANETHTSESHASIVRKPTADYDPELSKQPVGKAIVDPDIPKARAKPKAVEKDALKKLREGAANLAAMDIDAFAASIKRRGRKLKRPVEFHASTQYNTTAFQELIEDDVAMVVKAVKEGRIKQAVIPKKDDPFALPIFIFGSHLAKGHPGFPIEQAVQKGWVQVIDKHPSGDKIIAIVKNPSAKA